MISFLRDRINTQVILGFFGLLAVAIMFATIRECSADDRDAQIECYKHTIDPKVCDPNTVDTEVRRMQLLDSCKTYHSVDECLRLFAPIPVQR